MQIRRKREHKIDPCAAPKKTKKKKKKKIRRCNSYTHFISFSSRSYYYIAQDLKYKFSKISTL